mgnify:CR=1 FL=1|tara:strand:+ start:193 stop:402 length:210 start_codon:yes stop_codon:yes gene_type:complete
MKFKIKVRLDISDTIEVDAEDLQDATDQAEMEFLNSYQALISRSSLDTEEWKDDDGPLEYEPTTDVNRY